MTAHDIAPSTPAAPPIAPEPAAAATCGDCGTVLQGPWCHACGQPVQGMVRHLASVMSDVGDTLFNVDSRIFRSLLPLYLRPGFLTNEYLAGRRTRYVTPFRLFFFLCVVAFFAIQFGINLTMIDEFGRGEVTLGDIRSAQTPEELDARRQAYLALLEAAAPAAAGAPRAKARLDAQVAAAQAAATERARFLRERAQAIANGQPTPTDPAAGGTIEIDGVAWQPTRESVRVAWLPEILNERLFIAAQRVKDNLVLARREPSHLVEGVLSVLPQTMFVLMPLFALLLKFAYVFKRRLYMEHLMVALHSHAFAFLSLLLLVLVDLLGGWLVPRWPATAGAFTLLTAAMWSWLFVYPLLMAKRVYRQGWLMTLFKYGFVGTCYLVLLALGISGALVASLALT
ncbi:DUF3667 domain-containing protein [Dokdonella sp.]|uniref:DUF3667 domain-containing protein n=1 Tax=Dokdonella sp. TaxID=2291710 RepID=UPI0027B89312|nr:DUF3667 domain-containing protein [Dokdonella sp.]